MKENSGPGKGLAHAACAHFQGVMKTFRLEEAFFAQTDVRRIVSALIELEERRENDNE